MRELACRAERRDPRDCTCTLTPTVGWTTQPLSLDESSLAKIGTLVPDDGSEPTYQEYLPDGSGYWSDEAPIAPHFFPYNRCDLWQCTACGRLYLRYNEVGGYFVDRRIRAVTARLITDVTP